MTLGKINNEDLMTGRRSR